MKYGKSHGSKKGGKKMMKNSTGPGMKDRKQAKTGAPKIINKNKGVTNSGAV